MVFYQFAQWSWSSGDAVILHLPFMMLKRCKAISSTLYEAENPTDDPGGPGGPCGPGGPAMYLLTSSPTEKQGEREGWLWKLSLWPLGCCKLD